MEAVEERKPLCLITRTFNSSEYITLERPFIIYTKYQENQLQNGEKPSKRARKNRKTFAFNILHNKNSKENFIAISVAKCSKKDQFCRKIANNIVTGRLEKILETLNTYNLNDNSGLGDIESVIFNKYGSIFNNRYPATIIEIPIIDKDYYYLEALQRTTYPFSIDRDIISFIEKVYQRFMNQIDNSV